jgi:LacI family transcriptional regulator, sucrose operon repressor
MASIKDVAKRANVGIGTVSRAINGTGYVSVEAKKRIDKAVKELDYKPNELARNLFRNRSGIIGVVVPNLEHQFFSRLCKDIECDLYERGYKTMICNTIGISNRERDYLDMLDRNMVDGIITGAHSLDDEEYLKINKPIVALDRDFGDAIPLIHSNHQKGGRLAAEALIQSGCKHVIQFSTSSLVNTPSNKRHVEFERVCKENGVNVITVETLWNSFETEYLMKTMKKYMNKYTEIDGVFTADMTAAYCLNALHELGRKVPEEVKIVGYDGLDVIYLTTPNMTSVAQNIEEIAKHSVDTIIKLVDGKTNFERRQILDVTLIQGKTT